MIWPSLTPPLNPEWGERRERMIWWFAMCTMSKPLIDFSPRELEQETALCNPKGGDVPPWRDRGSMANGLFLSSCPLSREVQPRFSLKKIPLLTPGLVEHEKHLSSKIPPLKKNVHRGIRCRLGVFVFFGLVLFGCLFVGGWRLNEPGSRTISTMGPIGRKNQAPIHQSDSPQAPAGSRFARRTREGAKIKYPNNTAAKTQRIWAHSATYCMVKRWA